MSQRHVLSILGEVDPDVLSGGTRSLLRAIPGLEQRGWEFTHWTAVPSATEHRLKQEGSTVIGERRLLKFSLEQLRRSPGIRRRLASSLGYLHRFRAALHAIKPEVVIGNTVGTLPELLIARAHGFPTVLHVLEILPERVRHRLAVPLLSRASTEMMVPSEATARQFHHLHRRIHVVRTGIQVPADVVERGARNRAGNHSPVVAGFLGTISHRKGSDVLVAAAERLRSRGSAVEFRICGRCIEGAERPRAKAILRRALALGISHREEVDPLEELPAWDLFVLPSRQDPFPNAVLEAMAIGVPVVASRVDGIAEQVGEDAGVLVPAGDPSTLADAIAELESDHDRRRELSNAARERVAKCFSVQSQVEQTERVLEAAIGAR